MPPSVENMEEIPKPHTGDSLLNYFMTMYMDGIEISWGAEVHTEESLLEAMKGMLQLLFD